jgi:hypothetical protein
MGDRQDLALPTMLSKGLPWRTRIRQDGTGRRSCNSYAVPDPVFRGIGPQVPNGTLRVFDVSGKGRLEAKLQDS